MLGELIAEAKGKTILVRVLPTEEPQLEITEQGTATFLGIEGTAIETFVQKFRPGGILYGEGDAIFTSKDGEVAKWKGAGIGHPTGSNTARFVASGTFRTTSEKLDRLNHVVSLIEYETFEDGSYQWKMWEWK